MNNIIYVDLKEMEKTGYTFICPVCNSSIACLSNKAVKNLNKSGDIEGWLINKSGYDTFIRCTKCAINIRIEPTPPLLLAARRYKNEE